MTPRSPLLALAGLALGCLALAPAPASAACTPSVISPYVASAVSASANVFNFTTAPAPGVRTMLIVSIMTTEDTGAGPYITVASCSWGAHALTRAKQTLENFGPVGLDLETWTLQDPPDGVTGQVVITFTGGTVYNANAASAIEYGQVAGVGAISDSAGTALANSTTLTTTAANSLIYMAYGMDPCLGVSLDPAYTPLGSTDDPAYQDWEGVATQAAGAAGAYSGANSYTVGTYFTGGLFGNVQQLVELLPACAAVAPTPSPTPSPTALPGACSPYVVSPYVGSDVTASANVFNFTTALSPSANTMLIVTIMTTENSSGGPYNTVGTCTWGAYSLTRARQTLENFGPTGLDLETWCLQDPPAGVTAAVELTFAGGTLFNSNVASAIEYGAVTGLGAISDSAGTAVANSTTLTTTAANSLIYMAYGMDPCVGVSLDPAYAPVGSIFDSYYQDWAGVATQPSRAVGSYPATNSYTVGNYYTQGLFGNMQQLIELLPTCAGFPSPTATPSVTAVVTLTASATPSLMPTGSATASPSPTATASPTASPTASLTATPSPSPTASPTLTASPTATRTATPLQSPTPTPTASRTPFFIVNPMPTLSSTSTPSATATPTAVPWGGNSGDHRLFCAPSLIHGDHVRIGMDMRSLHGGPCKLRVLRNSGRTLCHLWAGVLQGGDTRHYDWDGRAEDGESLASGVYYAAFTDGDGAVFIQKVLIVR